MNDTWDYKMDALISNTTIDEALSSFMQLTLDALEKKKDDEHLTVAEVVAARLINEAFESDDMMRRLVERTADSVLGKELSRLMPLNRCALADVMDKRKLTIAEIIAIRIILAALEGDGAAMRLVVKSTEGKDAGNAVRCRARTYSDALYDLLRDKKVVDALLEVGFLRR